VEPVSRTAPGSREWLIEQLNVIGGDAGADFNDGIEPNGWFGWSIEVDKASGNPLMTVTFTPVTEEGDGSDDENTVTRRWLLVPRITADEDREVLR
jgi:hypothetical protein